MPTSPPRKHRFFSSVSYLALSYIAYVVLSSSAFRFPVANLPIWLQVALHWTWQPFTYPLSLGMEAVDSEIVGILLGSLLGVIHTYFWAWLICRVVSTRHRNPSAQSNDRDANAV